MGLISKEVIIKWNGNNKHYLDKGYIFTKFNDNFIVKVDDLSLGSDVKIDVQCDNCNTIKKIRYCDYYKKKKDNKYFCIKCASKLFGVEKCKITRLQNGISFYKWCFDHLPSDEFQDIMLRWDYDKNNCSPKDINFCSRGQNKKGFWFKCSVCNKHDSEQKNIANFVQGQKASILCNQCNSIYYKDINLVKYFVNIEDSKIHTKYSAQFVDMICPNCKNIRKFQISRLSCSGFSCPKCSDHISYPNKIGFNIMEQLGVNFITEYSPKWALGKKYDFFFQKGNLLYVMEMDGRFHYIDNPMNGQTKEESNAIDVEKDNLAEKNNIIMIRVGCQESTLEYIKTNILSSKLSTIFDLSTIDWSQCSEYALISFVKKACDIWNQTHNINKICEKINLRLSTIKKYLNQGAKIGLCDYDTNVLRKNGAYTGVANAIKSVICLNTKEIFISIASAAEKYGLSAGSLSSCIKGNRKSLGKDIYGNPLCWQSYDEYILNNVGQSIVTTVDSEATLQEQSCYRATVSHLTAKFG